MMDPSLHMKKNREYQPPVAKGMCTGSKVQTCNEKELKK